MSAGEPKAGSSFATRVLPIAAFALGALPPFLLGFAAWPEIVTPAWFVTRGYRLYDAIFFPHTPLLILTTAGAGALAGFSATTFRSVAALSTGLTALLLVAAASGFRARLGALAAGVPLLALWTVYLEGPALWPEPFLAPLVLAACLLLERFERRGETANLVGAGAALGLAILVKQTSAWFALAALAWLALGSRRRSARAGLVFAAAFSAPYALFVLGWGAAFGTLAHVRWTLLHVVFTGLAGEIATVPALDLLEEAVAPFLSVVALALLLPVLSRPRSRSPLLPMALASFGMAWPRWGLLHLAGGTGLLVLAALRGLSLVPEAVRVLRLPRTPRARGLATAAGLGLLFVHLAVAVLGAGPLLADAVRGPCRFWDDEETRRWASAARARTRPGGPLFVYGAPYETLYPLTGTATPGGFYVNPSFWYCVNKDGIDERIVGSLRGRRDVPILFREPGEGRDGASQRQTATYRFLVEETVVEEKIDSRTSWRLMK